MNIYVQENFPDGKDLAQTLHDSGFKGVWMLDPGIKYEEKEGYEAYDTGCEKDVWVQNADGKPYVGECWPGPVVFPDFTQSKVRTWWAELVKEFVGNDIDGIWNDMNEPAVFKVTQTLIPLPTSTSLLIVSISRNMAYQHKITYFLSLYGCRLSGFAGCGLCQCCDRKEGCCMWVMNRQYQRQCQSRIYTEETKTWVALNRTLTTTMCTLQSFLSFFFLVS
jgi:alpha-glucosidase (family GH31 glycosyl hydrolase)